MDNLKNSEKLHRLRLRLISLAKLFGNHEENALFENNNEIIQLNRKSFMQIVHFLLQLISQDLANNLPWPVTNMKASEIFLKGLFKIVDDLKKQYPWSSVPHFQKSHFQDPRPENDKVVEFLLKLSSLTIYIVTDTRPGEETQEETLARKQALQAQGNQLRTKLEKLETAKRELEERDAKLSTQVTEKKQQLLDKRIIQSPDEFTISSLFKKKEELECRLLEAVKTLQSQNYSDLN